MTTMTRWLALCAMVPVLSTIGCGGDTTTVDKMNDAAPQEIPGGGIGSGAVDGKINVYAIDGDTKEPIAGAAVRVGEPDATEPLEGTTDETGLVTFKNPALQGAQTITVTAADHVAATWFGVNGANVTIPLGRTKPPTVETAQVSGTITGFDTLENATNHIWVALVSYSWSSKIGDPANDIQQPGGGMGPPPNACIKLPPPAPSQPCNWQLVTRTGKQMIFALIIDVDTKGTLMDQADDTRALYGFAFKTGVEVNAGSNLTGQTLELFPTDMLTDLKVTVPAAPAGMDASAAIPLLTMGDEGQIPLFFGDQVDVAKVPTLTGIFASGRYDVIARASVMDKPFPSTTTWMRAVDVTKDIAVPNYQATPTDLAATGGVYSFKAVSDATIHSVGFGVPMGERAWAVALYDNRTSFSLPTLSPDPLPVGSLMMSVEAITVPGVDVQNFDLETAQDEITALSDNGIEITH